MPEQSDNGEPVSQRTNHRGFGKRCDVGQGGVVPGIGGADKIQRRSEQQQADRSQPQPLQSLASLGNLGIVSQWVGTIARNHSGYLLPKGISAWLRETALRDAHVLVFQYSQRGFVVYLT